jgi:DNA polymerase-3 subunit beta
MTATCAGTIEAPGRAAVPAEALSKLLTGLTADAEVAIETIDAGMRVKVGRSRYRLPALPVDDFPPPPTTSTAAELVLNRDQVQCLLGSTAFAIATEQTRYYLCGSYLHINNGRLCSVSTDGYQLAKAVSDIAPTADALPASGVIIPKTVVDQILKFKANETRLRIGAGTIAGRADNITLTAKLIDGSFPDYRRLIPAAANAVAEVERAALTASLERMAAIATKERATLTLGWDGYGGARLTMGGGQIAEDIIDAETVGEAAIGLAISRFRNLVDAIDAEQLRLGIVAATDPLLVNPLDSSDLLALLMPCRDS